MNSEFCVAVHALVFLSHKQASLSSETLAKNICTHPARVRRVMAKLKRAGLVHSKEGVDGGYQFPHPPDGVTLRQVGEALGLSYICSTWHSGGTDMDCLIASGMGAVMDELFAQMDARCREYLQGITIGAVYRRILGGGQGKGWPDCGSSPPSNRDKTPKEGPVPSPTRGNAGQGAAPRLPERPGGLSE